ncbi:hypothetical protein [Sphingomonas profundi]|uniref:hypothetical protein n=1 Tax=Alterirhizorhabdus profundi TaxID=2681549 RepID=UPI0012E78DEC|nr:hypothetical protein [Sphingomonas profundi]
MEEINQALGALLDGVADVLTSGLGDAAAVHDESRAMQAELRGHAMTRALLGRQLSGLASSLTGEVQRRTEPRYAAYLQHPRYGREQHIDEAEAADRSLNKTLLPLLDAPTPANALAFWGAAVRVRAITAVMGTACIYPPVGEGASVRRRRREMTAADVPAPVASVLLAAAAGEMERGDAIVALQALEPTGHNLGAVVTKLVALLEHADGMVHLNRVVDALQRAMFSRDQQGERAGQARATAGSGTKEVERALRSQPAGGEIREARAPVNQPPKSPPARADRPSPAPALTAGGRAKSALERLGSSGSTLQQRLAASHAQMRKG